MWRLIQVLLVFSAALTGWAAAEPGAGSIASGSNLLTTSDLRCAGADPEYLAAYRSFLEAGVTDQGGHSYTSSIPILRKASQGARDLAVKLRCLLLLAWAQYLNSTAEEAQASAMESLTWAKQAADPADRDTPLLDSVKALIASNSIVRPADLKKCLKVSDDVSALMDDLFYLEKGRTAWRQMAALRARKVNALLEAAITDGGKAWGIPAAALEKIRLVLKEKYKERLEIDFSELADDVENEYAKMMLEELVK